MSIDGIRSLAICLLVPTTALLLSLVLTHAIIPVLIRLGMVDIPGNRHLHDTPRARGGGIAIMAAFFFVTVAYAYLGRDIGVCQSNFASLKIFIPLVILIPLGIADDKFRLQPKVKLFFQVIAGTWAWHLGVHIDLHAQCHIATSISAFLTIFWITAMINAFNMIDGVDGLAGGIGAISAIALAFITWFTGNRFNALILLILAGSLIGFLFYNWHPAKLFMGDTGSMCIGYILGIAGLNATSQIATISAVVIPILVCGVPVLDIFFAVWRRIINPVKDDPEHKQGFWRHVLLHLGNLGTADGEHLHHRMLTFYHKNQRKTVSNIYLLAIVMACIGISILFIPSRLWWLAFVIVFASIAICIYRYANIELWHSTEIVYKNYQKPRFGHLFNILNPIWDVCVCSTAFIIVRNQLDFLNTAYFIIPIFLVIIVSRTYSVFWNYPSAEEYFRLLLTIVAAVAVSAIFNAIFQFYPFTLREFIAATAIADAAIIGERMLFHALRMALIRQHVNASYANTTPDITTLLCGICPQGRMYVNSVMVDIGRAGRENIIGFISNDQRFSHSYCYGLRVLGTVQDLAQIHEDHHLGKIVICSDNLKPQERDELVAFCQKHGIILKQYRCIEVDYSDNATSSSPTIH
jgi:UDP-GlcNAc:undecaprenyl-phosphate GlcNAc-1-phosphate transferase